MDQLSITENVDTLFRSLQNFTQNEGVIGKAVVQGNKTLMPVVSVTVGYGGGNGLMGKNNSSSGSMAGMGSTSSSSGALGLGAKLNTEAILILDDQSQEVSMLPMSASGASQIVDKIPQILTGMNKNKQSGQSQQQSSSQSTSM